MQIYIIGGGPSGCSAAHFLSTKGNHDVTIFEQENYVGGLARTRLFKNIPFEFGPQILFSKDESIKDLFLKFIPCHKPPSSDQLYHYLVSLDGLLNKLYDFPISMETVLKLPQAEQIIWELYNINLTSPSYDNFESYTISRIGPTLYELFIKNYNKKAWLRDPVEMDTDWVHYRPLTLTKTGSRFANQWQGHPGNYNTMWEAMTGSAKVVKATCNIDSDYNVYANGEKLNADMIITSIPISEQLEYIDTLMIFASIRTEKLVLPAAFITFPNNYSFVRVFEYKQQFHVDSEETLLSFDVPFINRVDVDAKIEEVKRFCKKVIKTEAEDIWIEKRYKVYPVATARNSTLFNRALIDIQTRNIVPIGRGGLHAYCSKDTAVRMGRDAALNIEGLTDPKTKLNIIKQIRSDLH